MTSITLQECTACCFGFICGFALCLIIVKHEPDKNYGVTIINNTDGVLTNFSFQLIKR